MSKPVKQIHLAAHFPGVNNTTVWSDPAAGSQIEFGSFVHFAQTAERAKFDFFFLAEGLRLREQNGQIYDLDVVGRPDTFTVLAALAAVTDRSAWPARSTPPSTSRTRWPGSSPPSTTCRPAGPRGTSSPRGTRSPARTSGAAASSRRRSATSGPSSSWRRPGSCSTPGTGDEIVADQESGVFLARPATPGAFDHHDEHFDIAGRFNVPRSPQGRPVIFQAGDSEEGREFAAAAADAIFTRHGTLEAGQAFYADVKGRLAALRPLPATS